MKGNIGHLEAASGVASLIKTLLMIQHNVIPVQASFDSLNPAIPELEPDRLIIPISTRVWDAKFKVACINNYGASGSNATMIVCQPPKALLGSQEQSGKLQLLSRYPLFVSASSEVSLKANCAALRAQCASISTKMNSKEILASLAYNLALKQNRALPYVLATSASNVPEVNDQLIAGANGEKSKVTQIPIKAQPVVLVFGGQIGDAVGLGNELYDSSTLLRSYLDQCDEILRSFGLSGLYPAIFQTTPVSDIVALQSMVFSLQYACSKAWMESGLKVDAVIGHSLGQLAAMCISGSLSIEEGLKLVSGRASLMQKHWGPERGSMIAIETDSGTLSIIIAAANAEESSPGIEIACYNGPTSHVLVGREASITRVQEIIKDKSICANLVNARRLRVTHGFHSVFTEPLLLSLTTLAGELTFQDPIIPLETCSDGQSWERPSPELIAQHTRTPVYFGQAVNRLAQRLGPCTWLEAGSASSVVGMVRRALDPEVTSQHMFQSADLNSSGAVDCLVNTTVNLWKQGHQVQFWPFHQLQRTQYTPINLPPYQFEKTKHWLDWKEPMADVVTVPTPTELLAEDPLMSFVGYTDQCNRKAHFSINPQSSQWKAHVSGHAVLGQPLCPAPMYVELSTQAAYILNREASSETFIPLIENMEIRAPLGLAQEGPMKMAMNEVQGAVFSWDFEMSSQTWDESSSPVSYATGRISLERRDPGLIGNFSRFEKLIGNGRFDSIKSNPKSEVLQGAMVYKFFSKVVDYAEWYKGVRGVFALDGEAVGRVVPPSQDEEGLSGMITSPLALDSFIQVSGLHVNNFNECGPNQVFVCTKIDRIQISPKYDADDPESHSWDVYTNFTRPGERTVSNDIYVFDSSNQNLVMIIFGAFFTRVAISSLAKVLSHANGNTSDNVAPSSLKQPRQVPVKARPGPPVRGRSAIIPAKAEDRLSVKPIAQASVKRNVTSEVRELIHRVADIPIADIQDDKSLEDLGVDSLMMTEVATETAKFFQFKFDAHDFETLPNIRSLGNFVLSKVNGGTLDEEDPSASSSDAEDTLNATPNSSSESMSSTSSDLGASEDVVGRLARLLATHLETAEIMSKGTNLASLGLDSLMCMELATDIKGDFGVELDMRLVNDDSSFGDLCDMVTSQRKPLEPVAKAQRKRTSMETVTYKQAGDLALKADVYYPSEVTKAKRPVGNAS